MWLYKIYYNIFLIHFYQFGQRCKIINTFNLFFKFIQESIFVFNAYRTKLFLHLFFSFETCFHILDLNFTCMWDNFPINIPILPHVRPYVCAHIRVVWMLYDTQDSWTALHRYAWPNACYGYLHAGISCRKRCIRMAEHRSEAACGCTDRTLTRLLCHTICTHACEKMCLKLQQAFCHCVILNAVHFRIDHHRNF